MKKYVLLVIIGLVFSSIHVWGQEENPIDYGINKIYPVSPQAASLGKYGDIPVNLATGRINYQIPLYTIKEGDIELPISLSYNYSGLLTDETIGYAGLGWTVNLDGQITRQIKGIDDFVSGGYKQENVRNFIENIINTERDNEKELLNYYENVLKGELDSSSDKYILNIGNIQTSFVWDKNFNPLFLKNENYKVESFSDNFKNQGLKLIDDRGNEYIFNELEKSYIFPDQDQYISSWKITKIKQLKSNKEIYFEYDTDENIFEQIYLRERKVKVKNRGNIFNEEYTKNTNFSSRIFFRKIKKIITSKEIIELNYTKCPNKEGVFVISTIIVKTKEGDIVRTIDLKYNPWVNSRTTLQSVVNNEKIWNFKYYGKLPSDNIKRQKDLWGYYNGDSRSLLDGNSRKPVFEKTLIGALKQIEYPTKGFTTINYEGNSIKTDNPILFPFISDGVRQNALSASVSYDQDLISAKELILNYNQDISFQYIISTDPQNPNPGKVIQGSVSLLNANNEIVFDDKKICAGELQPCTGSLQKAGILHLSKGVYTIQSKANQGVASSIRIEYGEPKKMGEFNQQIGGIRVKSTVDCSSQNDDCIVNQFKYDKFSLSSGILLQKPIFDDGYFELDLDCPSSTESNKKHTISYFQTSESIVPLSTFRGSPVLYKQVIESNDNKIGKSIYHYSGTPQFNYLEERADWRRGNVEKLQILGNNLKLKKEILYNYELNQLSEKNSRYFNLRKIKAIYRGGIGKDGQLCYEVKDKLHYSMSTWLRQSENYNLVKTIINHHFDNKITSKVSENNYNDKGYLVSTKEVNSEGKELEINYKYPHDLLNEPYVESLIMQNHIGIPLQTTVTKGGTIVSDQLTQYATFGNLYLPQYIFSKKGATTSSTATDRKLSYDRYDAKGNLLQYHTEEGLYTSILWGYNGQYPIAKVEGARYDEISNYANNISGLRLAVPHAMVTTYTYEPLVGVTSITDPSGQVQNFTYDEFNRLEYVLDGNGKVIKRYRYNYEEQKLRTYGNLAVSLTGVSSYVLLNQSIGFSVSKTSGSNRLSYKWKINGSLQSTTGSILQKTFNSQGNYTISVEVKDLETGQSTTLNKTVSAYPVLHTPSLTSNITSSSIVKGSTINFTANGIGGGSGSRRYEWYINNVKQSGTATSLSQRLLSAGTYTVYFKVIDTITGWVKNSNSKVYSVYTPLNTPSLSSNYTYLVKGTTVRFTGGNIGNGSGNRRYEWYVNNAKQSGTGTTLDYNFGSTETYTVKFRVVDTKIPNHYKEVIKTVYVYNPLNTPSLSSNYTYLVKGTTVRFTGGNIGNGSGNRRYEWYVNNTKQSGTSTTLDYNFGSTGTYTVKFRVVDTKIPNHYKEVIKTVYVYNPLNTPSLSSNYTYLVKGTTVRFTGGNIGNGSYSRRYEWYVNNTKQSGTGTTLDYHFGSTGTYTVKFRVVDTKIPNHYREVIKTVYAYNPLNTPSISATRAYSVQGWTETFTVGGIGNGSGHRRYEWYVNNVKQSYTGTQFSYKHGSTGVSFPKYRTNYFTN